MKLKFLQFIERRLRSITDCLLRWHEEVEWQIVALTPVGPNPHNPNTIEWYLWEEGNRLKAEFRLKVKDGPDPWVELAKKDNQQ